MTYLSIIDKLMILFSLLKDSIFLLIFIGILIFSVVLRILGKINNRKMFVITILSLIGTFLAVLLMNYDILSKTFDNFLDIIFTNIYFPSIYVYLFVIVSSYVIVIVTLLNRKISGVSRISNYIMAFILNFILIVNLNIIAKDKIDIFSTSSMYTNVSLVSMLELSMNVYILWMVIISSVFIINNLTSIILVRRESKKLVNGPVIIGGACLEVKEDKLENRCEDLGSSSIVTSVEPISLIVEDNIDKVTEKNISEVVEKELKQEENVVVEPKFINNNIIREIKDKMEEQSAGDFTFNQYVKIEEEKKETKVINPILNQILNNSLPIQKEEVNINSETFTLNDYKIFSKMLKEAIKMNNRTTLNIRDMLNINLLNKFSYEEYSLFKRMLKSYTN